MDEKPAQIIIKEVSQSYGALSIIFGFIGIFILSPFFSDKIGNATVVTAIDIKA